MTINFTLILQVINFLIAYFIITKLLLKPAIAIIKQEDAAKNDFLNLISSRELETKNKELLKKSVWNMMLERFKKEKPVIKELEVSISWHTPQVQNISKYLTVDLKKYLSDFIVETVRHVK